VGGAAVGLVEYPDAGILRGQCVTDFRRAVVAAVVDEQQLKIGEGLRQDAFHCGAQIRPCVVHRGDYADFGMVRHRYFLL
jgi:hypothetical protein